MAGDDQRPGAHQDLADPVAAGPRPPALAPAGGPAGALGQFAYLDAELTVGGVLPLCRLRYLGSTQVWGFGLYLASSDNYEDQILPTGSFTGPATEALDCACNLYLAGPTF